MEEVAQSKSLTNRLKGDVACLKNEITSLKEEIFSKMEMKDAQRNHFEQQGHISQLQNRVLESEHEIQALNEQVNIIIYFATFSICFSWYKLVYL